MKITNLQEFRSVFPALKDSLYFDIATKAPINDNVLEMSKHFFDNYDTGGGKRGDWLQATERVRMKFANLIGSKPTEIAITKNTSEGINIAASGINWKPGDNILVALDIEHPNNVYAWLHQRRHGVNIKKIETPHGYIDIDEILKQIDDNTRLITVSFVNFLNGSVVDLKALGEICREKSIIFVVDAIQGLGGLPLNVEEMKIDILACGAHKRMMGIYGLGFFYCRESILEQVEPTYAALRSVPFTDDHQFVKNIDFEFIESAKKYEIGNFNYLGTYAAEIGLDMINGLGVECIYGVISDLGHHMRTSLHEMGLKLGVPYEENPQFESGIVNFESTNLQKIYEHLVSHNVECSVRRDSLRLGLHAYNTKEDVDRILTLIKNSL